MVAKGHDFPDVTLVIVADADVGLYVPDFRAAERTFQLLTQVAGRAGRAERPGRVLVQTSNPDVPCIRMALEGNEERFYAEELSIRERLGYPALRGAHPAGHFCPPTPRGPKQPAGIWWSGSSPISWPKNCTVRRRCLVCGGGTGGR